MATREIGIRVALGGQPRDVRGLVVRESMTIAVGGLVIGTGGSLALSKGIESMLFGISRTDPLTYGTIATVLLIVAAMAAFGPARRATRVDPLVALRD
jgi:putative ABC transport system permease protein